MTDRGLSLPPLTHLQFLILGVVRAGETPGRVVREALMEYGVRRTAPAFYQVMSRLEKARLLEGSYEQVVVGDQAVTERRYRITKLGVTQWEATRQFYAEAVPGSLRRRWSHG